jgi:hypothetical protein
MLKEKLEYGSFVKDMLMKGHIGHEYTNQNGLNVPHLLESQVNRINDLGNSQRNKECHHMIHHERKNVVLIVNIIVKGKCCKSNG